MRDSDDLFYYEDLDILIENKDGDICVHMIADDLFEPDTYFTVVDELGQEWTDKKIREFIKRNKIKMFVSGNTYEFQLNRWGELVLVDDYGQKEYVGPPEFNIVWNKGLINGFEE